VSWDEVHLPHRALPELDFAELDTSVELFGHRLRLPLLISSMTGGHADAEAVNAALGRAAERHGLGMGLGSGRAMLSRPELTRTFAVARREAPSALLYANIGVPQLIAQRDRSGYTSRELLPLIESLRADALAVHLNFLQEAVQPEGDLRARGCLEAVRRLCAELPVPVLAKETGAGIGPDEVRALARAGVAAVDVSGTGGTSWAVVEAKRAAERGDARRAQLGERFATWGIPTPVALWQSRDAGVPLLAGGGIRSGLDAARAIALGAVAVTVARPLLVAALQGDAALDAWIEQFALELKTALFLTGARTIAELRQVRPAFTGTLWQWLHQPPGAPGR
jgi:isopentenyl-diphosphate delta-isomerase